MDHATRFAEASQRVIDCWESGNLAEAVNILSGVLFDYRQSESEPEVRLSQQQVAVVRDALQTAIDELDYTTGLTTDYEPEDIEAMHKRIADMNALWDVLSGVKRDELGQVLLSDEDARKVAESYE